MRLSSLLIIGSLVLVLIGATLGYYTTRFPVEINTIFLTTTTFLFSIFTGFFITRQATRFNKVREVVTQYDGRLSNIYRTSAHVSPALQEAFGVRIMSHYTDMIKNEAWDYHLVNKSTTLTDLHALLHNHTDDSTVTKLGNQALGAIIKDLADCQTLRKQLVALREERVPVEQWCLIVFFAFMLMSTVSVLPSAGAWFSSLLKAAFVVSVGTVILILYRLDTLRFSERMMGARSAQDVLDIIRGTR
jgi:hypothetical protein